MICKGCKRDEELRLGYCFDCAVAGEKKAACRSVLVHVSTGVRHFFRHNTNYRYDFKWAWERLTKTGDYLPNGYFEKQHGKEIWK